MRKHTLIYKEEERSQKMMVHMTKTRYQITNQMTVQSTYKFSSSTFKMLYFLRSIFLAKMYQKKETIEKILSFSPKILTLTYSKVIHTCFSYAETPVSKILFEMFFGLYLVFIIWFLYLILKLTSKFLKKTSNIWAKFKSCLLRAFLLGILFSYQNLVMGAFTLVRCVDIANMLKFYTLRVMYNATVGGNILSCAT